MIEDGEDIDPTESEDMPALAPDATPQDLVETPSPEGGDDKRDVEDLLRPTRLKLIRTVLDNLNEGTAQSVKKHKPTLFSTLAEQRKAMLPLPSLPLQYLFGSYGLRYPGLIEIIGDTNLGKSTLALQIAAHIMLTRKAIVGIFDCENKPISPDRARRVLHTDPAVADELMKNIFFTSVYSLEEFENALDDFVREIRRRIKDRNIPIVVIVDPLSALMSQPEAAGGVYEYNRRRKPNEKRIATGEGSNLTHAKWGTQKNRRLPAFLSTNNVLLIVNDHQTVKIDMSGSSTPTAEWVTNMNNTTSLGGRAWKAKALAVLVLARRGFAVQSDNSVTGIRVVARLHKNSYGPSLRVIEWEFRTAHEQFDRANFQDPAIHNEVYFCNLLASKSIAGIKARENGTYQIDFNDTIRFSGLSAEHLYRLVTEDRQLLSHVAQCLNIQGYDEIIDKIIEASKAAEELKSSASEASQKAAPAKRRGRPPKKLSEPAAPNPGTDSTNKAPAKKRGRKPKNA